MKLVPFLLPMALLSTLADAQTDERKWDLKTDFALINRCAHATRLVIKSVELYPRDKKTRDRFLESVFQTLKQTNQLGEQTPSEMNLMFATVDDMLNGDTDFKHPASRDWLISQSAAACALHSSRIGKPAAP